MTVKLFAVISTIQDALLDFDAAIMVLALQMQITTIRTRNDFVHVVVIFIIKKLGLDAVNSSTSLVETAR